MKMKQFLIGLATATLLVVPALVMADTLPPNTGQFSAPPNTGQLSPQPVSGGQTQASVTNPLGVNSFCGLIKAILAAAIQIGIPIAVLFIVYAGFRFVMAQGSPEKLTEARKNLLYTLVGIAIFLGAWLLAQVIANTVNTVGQGANGGSLLISCQ